MSDYHSKQTEQTSSSTTSKPGVLCTNFNQDASSVSIGTKGGLRIWSINNAGLEIQELHNDEKIGCGFLEVYTEFDRSKRLFEALIFLITPVFYAKNSSCRTPLFQQSPRNSQSSST